jgi:hypothetical protein
VDAITIQRLDQRTVYKSPLKTENFHGFKSGGDYLQKIIEIFTLFFIR